MNPNNMTEAKHLSTQVAGSATELLDKGIGVLQLATEGIAKFVSSGITPRQMALGLTRLQTIHDALGDILDELKRRVKEAVLADGVQTTEKGSRQLKVGDALLEIRPHRTGLDHKKVEALLRSQGKEPHDYMDAVITYKVNASKLPGAGLNAEELKACEFDLTWAVQKPKVA